MERWVSKVISLFVIFGVSIVVNLLPIKVSAHFVRQGERGQKILSCLMCFGGGVFFATYMLHLAPEVNQIFNEAIIEPYGINYPLSELVMIVGFLMILFLEYFVHHLGSSIHVPDHHGHKTSESKEPIALSMEEKCTLKGASDHIPMENGHAKSYVVEVDGDSTAMTIRDGDVEISVVAPRAPQGNGWTRSLLLLLALSLHHVFEGMGIGLQHSTTDVWSLCIAIISHEVVIAFSFGLQLVKAYSSKLKIVLAAVLCNGMTPLGIIIGTVMMETTGEYSHPIQIANGVLQALSTGVFIYVTFFEILQTELTAGGHELCKLLCMLLGIVVLSVLVIIPEDTNMDTLLYHVEKNCTSQT